jgi:alpha/beta superfamily hydrolase
MEKTVQIAVAGLTLEGRFEAGAGAGGVVITHPHPLYGGSLDNNVVWTAKQAFGAAGWSTLRLNFRGVGGSTGAYGQGLAEVADLFAAVDFLQHHSLPPYHVAGYSFGAFVAAQAMVQGLAADGFWCLAPPIAFMDLSCLPQTPRLQAIIVGDQDDLCPLARLRDMFTGSPRPPEIRVVEGTDHFFAGREKKLFEVLVELIRSLQ